jgi:integrase
LPGCDLGSLEGRGLHWADVDLRRGELHIRQRADRCNKMGRPKSEAGERTVPIAPMLANTLREWKLACPKGEHGLVFPNGRGHIENPSNILQRGLAPVQTAAGVVTAKGKTKTPASTACGISMPRGASTDAWMAVWNCR